MTLSKGTVWVVEVNFADGKGFVPTAGAHLTREDARVEKIMHWDHQVTNPSFARIRKYQMVGA